MPRHPDVFILGGGILSVLEGWRQGPKAHPIDDAEKIGPLLSDLAERARRNVDMQGRDID